VVWRLESKRLLLRVPASFDVSDMVRLGGDYDVAKNLSRMPYPYFESHAREWLATTAEKRAAGTDYAFAITRKDDGAYLGGCGLHKRDLGAFEFGYWLGKPFWGQGYATEAARRLVAFAFLELGVDRVIAGHFHDNPASGNVLKKLGCVADGAGERDCLARGHTVYCHNVLLTAADFWKKKAA
jgi:[ribosomal protein S5]-alanine N-acetyltransferase